MSKAENCGHVKDIARQLVEDNPDINVVLGGGRANFFPTSKGGKRKDGLDLVELWKQVEICFIYMLIQLGLLEHSLAFWADP